MDVPYVDTAECGKCQGRIVYGKTPRMSKGQPVIIAVDQDLDPAGNILLTLVGDTYHAGTLKPNQAQGARSVGLKLHLPHKLPCLKRGAGRGR